MSILTILLLIMVVWFVYHSIVEAGKNTTDKKSALRHFGYGKSIGLFAMITGILGQLIGFYQAFSAIERAGDISPALVFSGLKISMITTLYGIFIYLLSIVLWFIASLMFEKRIP